MPYVCTDYTFRNNKSFKPSIGIVKKIVDDKSFEIEYLKGNWSTVCAAYPKPWLDVLPSTSIVLMNFELEHGKLTREQKRGMKSGYQYAKQNIKTVNL